MQENTLFYTFSEFYPLNKLLCNNFEHLNRTLNS